MPPSLDAAVLLAYHEEETARWKEWFLAHPEALAAKCDIARVDTLGGLLYHIFWVEQMYACRLHDQPIPELNPPADAKVEDLFALGEGAYPMIRDFIASATPETLAEVIIWQSRFAGELSFSKGKILLHAIIHGIRHWAQVPPILRAAGFDTNIPKADGKPWMHDFLFTGAME